MTVALTNALTGVSIALIVSVLIYVVYQAVVHRNSLHVGAIRVPGALTDSGFGSDVVTRHIGDAINNVFQLRPNVIRTSPKIDYRVRLNVVRTGANVAQIVPDIASGGGPVLHLVGQAVIQTRQEPRAKVLADVPGDMPDITITQAGISIQSLSNWIRSLLPGQSLSGEFTQSGAQVSLRLRLDGSVVFDAEEAGPNAVSTLIGNAAPIVVEAVHRSQIERRPNSVVPHMRLASLLHFRKRFDSATDEYREVTRLDPNNAAAYVGLGNLLADQGLSGISVNQGKLDDAAKQYREAVRIDPKSAAPHIGLGVIPGGPGGSQRRSGGIS
jgi:hypothetical protein